jgi:hypothetical protein
VAEPAAEPDPDFLSAIAGPVEAEPRSPACRCDDLQRGNRARLDAPAVEDRAQVVKLDPPISLRVEMLQRATAACAEMAARRGRPPGTCRDQIDDMPLTAAAAPRAKASAHPVARHSERQVDRVALPCSDAVARDPDPLDRNLDQFRLGSGEETCAAALRQVQVRPT